LNPRLFIRCSSAALLLGCAAARPQSSDPSAKVTTLAVPRTVITPEAASSLPEMYRQAEELGRSGRHSEASRAFHRVFELEPNGELADEALFQSAVEHHLAGELEPALVDYEQVARLFPDREFSLSAVVRATTLSVHLEHYQRAAELAQRALAAEARLSAEERVLIYAASALGRLEQNDEKSAESFIEKGRELIDARQLDVAGKLSYELAPLYFALGELRRRRAERIVFVPTPPNFAEVLERRCQLLLDAQSAYSDTWRAYDAHWSAMAGFRVGELYERLHQDLMHIEPPTSADSEQKRQLFEGAMRLRYAILLEKASGMMEHTLAMAERTKELSPWVDRARVAKAEIGEAMKREQAALDKLPFSRATLQSALDDLQRKASTAAIPAPVKAPLQKGQPASKKR
jgi:tetratricopeptide (TPR) repeat protein